MVGGYFVLMFGMFLILGSIFFEELMGQEENEGVQILLESFCLEEFEDQEDDE